MGRIYWCNEGTGRHSRHKGQFEKVAEMGDFNLFLRRACFPGYLKTKYFGKNWSQDRKSVIYSTTKITLELSG